jgi:hypothetical protein
MRIVSTGSGTVASVECAMVVRLLPLHLEAAQRSPGRRTLLATRRCPAAAVHVGAPPGLQRRPRRSAVLAHQQVAGILMLVSGTMM